MPRTLLFAGRGYDTVLVKSCAVNTHPCREARSAVMMPTPFIAKSAADLKAFRIAPTDSNYFACLLDPLADGVSFTLVVEIFEPGGKTPPNMHTVAEEAFFVMAGTGRALADGDTREIGPGDVLVLRPGTEHVVENTGPGKLYCLTMMTPNEGFAELIRHGTPVELTQEDRAFITGAGRC
jgi:mannose-6-phosphate isomerase-like protein (cupin superfamily)